MPAWATGAWHNQAWFGTAWATEEVVQPVEVSGGGAGYPVYRKRRRLTDFPNRHLDAILNEVVEEYYREIIDSDLPKEVKQEAAEVVRPFAKKTRGYPKQIDWTALKLEADRVALLIQIYHEELLDDEDEFLMMH